MDYSHSQDHFVTVSFQTAVTQHHTSHEATHNGLVKAKENTNSNWKQVTLTAPRNVHVSFSQLHRKQLY